MDIKTVLFEDKHIKTGLGVDSHIYVFCKRCQTTMGLKSIKGKKKKVYNIYVCPQCLCRYESLRYGGGKDEN